MCRLTRPKARPWLHRLVTAGLVVATAWPLWCVAQEGAAAPMSLVDAREAAQLRSLLAEPAPANAGVEPLRRHFLAKDDAALRLGDPAVREQVLRAAMERLPQDGRWPNNLGNLLAERGRGPEARRLFELAIDRAARPAAKLFYRGNLVDLLVRNSAPDAASELSELGAEANRLLVTLQPSLERVAVMRVLGGVAAGEAVLLSRRALLKESLALRVESLRRVQEAFELQRSLPGVAPSEVAYVASGVANAQKSLADAMLRLDRHAEAEAILAEHVRFIQAQRLPAGYAAGAHHALASLRVRQRDFVEGERQLRLSMAAMDGLRISHVEPNYIAKVRDLVGALWARGDAATAARELEQIDRELAASGADKGRARMAFERGLVYIDNGRAAEAARLFESVAAENLKLLGSGHFFTAQAQGLQGVALWRRGDLAQADAAFDLLKEATLSILSPRNADFLNDSGYRRPVRQLVMATYLDAAARRGGLRALAAMGVADRMIAGGTGQALADAALRSAAGDHALAALVRQEQDLRNELQGLNQVLGAVGDIGSGGPGSADRVRARIAELDLQRQQLRDRIRTDYPGYDQLLRPVMPSPTDVAQRLRRDEVLVLAVPTAEALHVWAINADDLPGFARVDVSLKDLEAQVTRLREGLDLGLTGGRRPRFDAAAAHALYRLVLGPVAAQLQGRRHLVVATAGPLARLPFATLISAAAPANGPMPWLIRQMSVTQVPNVAAWSALREMPPRQPAPEALMAFADPTFAATRPAAPPRIGLTRQLAPAHEAAGAVSTLRYQDLPPLPETRDEVLAIAASLKADPERDLMLGPRATREALLAASRGGQLARKRVLVLATHGLLAGDLPGLSQPALALSAAEGQSNPLSAVLGLDDILGLKLDAEWVVLSACNTAAGAGRAEEALSGLARAFLYAGTRSLLVTHWAVETESAKLLTTATFAHHAANPGASKAESLRQAMLALVDHPKYGHPAYWAPFALIGDGAR